MKIYFVVNARMPNQKAHAIHIAKMCEAFIEQGVDMSLVVPSRASGVSLKMFYGLRVEVPLVRLPSFSFTRYGRLGYAIMGLSFMVSSSLYLLWKRMGGETFWIYTVDMDTFSHTALPFAGPTAIEMHSPKRPTFLSRLFFSRVRAVVATNPLIAEELTRDFSVFPVVCPNGVDMHYPRFSRKEARTRLGLSDGPLAMYVGRFYTWKGLKVLADASRLLSAQGITTLALGGSREEFQRVFGESGTLVFAQTEPNRVFDWMQAADVLLLLGTRKNQESNKFTSPMKTFEYLSTGRAVVVSDTEALRSLKLGNIVAYCEPDDPTSLAECVVRSVAESAAPEIEMRRRERAAAHSWEARAKKILAFMHSTVTLSHKISSS